MSSRVFCARSLLGKLAHCHSRHGRSSFLPLQSCRVLRPEDLFHRRCLLSTDATRAGQDDIINNIGHGDDNEDTLVDNNTGLPITSFVTNQMKLGKLRHDEEQLDLARRLDEVRMTLMETDASVIPADQLSVGMFNDAPPKGPMEKAMALAGKKLEPLIRIFSTSKTPRGIYIHGSVGVGKSFLMDLFAAELMRNDKDTTLSAHQNRKIRRCHFHEFMLDVHMRIHQHKKQHPKTDPLPAVALSLAQEARILCLDEFQVTDIADAMILQRLFRMMWMNNSQSKDIGMVVIATSNRDPDSLYEGGLNRVLFVPFIGTLKQYMDVIPMNGSNDYRRDNDNIHDDDAITQSYFWPEDSLETRQALTQIFTAVGNNTEETTDTALPVRMGRKVQVPKSNDNCAWLDFMSLCGMPLGSADYLAICERYPVVIVDHVPQLNASRFNEARRFVTFIDAVYESKTRLVIASQVPLEDLLVHFDATVESNDGDEEIAVAEISDQEQQRQMEENSPQQEPSEMFVKGEGGSSSSAATTFLRNNKGDVVEWSATGRIGVSLAQLSAVRDVSFSFERAASRLVEMNNGTWGRAY